MTVSRSFFLVWFASCLSNVGALADAAPSKPANLIETPHPQMFVGSCPRPFIRYLHTLAGEGAITMVADRGPISEFVISCGNRRDGIVSYSKVEQVYCDSHLSCGTRFDAAASLTCHQK